MAWLGGGGELTRHFRRLGIAEQMVEELGVRGTRQRFVQNWGLIQFR